MFDWSLFRYLSQTSSLPFIHQRCPCTDGLYTFLYAKTFTSFSHLLSRTHGNIGLGYDPYKQTNARVHVIPPLGWHLIHVKGSVR